jgi:hypothetical protein
MFTSLKAKICPCTKVKHTYMVNVYFNFGMNLFSTSATLPIIVTQGFHDFRHPHLRIVGSDVQVNNNRRTLSCYTLATFRVSFRLYVYSLQFRQSLKCLRINKQRKMYEIWRSIFTYSRLQQTKTGNRVTAALFTSLQSFCSYKVNFNILAYRSIAMQRPRDGRIYQGRFWATVRLTRSRETNSRTTPFARQQIPNNATVGLQEWENCFLRGPCRGLELSSK